MVKFDAAGWTCAVRELTLAMAESWTAAAWSGRPAPTDPFRKAPECVRKVRRVRLSWACILCRLALGVLDRGHAGRSCQQRDALALLDMRVEVVPYMVREGAGNLRADLDEGVRVGRSRSRVDRDVQVTGARSRPCAIGRRSSARSRFPAASGRECRPSRPDVKSNLYVSAFMGSQILRFEN